MKHNNQETKSHIGIVSVNYEVRPEGICTARLVRALLDYGFRITLITSTKAEIKFSHPNLKCLVFSHRPREPRFIFRWLAKIQGNPQHNFYAWGQKVLRHHFSSKDLPDIFYGRAWPYSSLIPAYFLSRKYHRPLISHLSDPIPPPDDTQITKQSLSDLQTILNYASAITFTNKETVSYQAKATPFDREKAFVLPHVSPNIPVLPLAGKEDYFYYIGSIGNRKSVLGLVMAAFRQFVEKNPFAKLNFVCPNHQDKEIKPIITESGTTESVKIHSFAPDIIPVMSSATVLISLDAKVKHSIWTPTKIIEYLSTNRKILALTSVGSPTERLLKPFPESCVVVTDYSANGFTQGLKKISELTPAKAHFEHRLASISDFRAENIAAKFEQICHFVQ